MAKCGNCGRYWSGHRYNNDRNVAYCYASENSTWFTPEEDMLPPAEQPAKDAGAANAEWASRMRDLLASKDERLAAWNAAEEEALHRHEHFDEICAQIEDHLDSLVKGGA